MSEVAQTPFFPVPVQWFEIPMNTARWGFVRLEGIAPTQDGRLAGSPPSWTLASAGEATSLKAPAVGQLLNERA